MRVTGGNSRGRILKVPDTGTVRPTSDKMRQMLYNMLAHSPWATKAGFNIIDAHVLDGFCGSGALGIEALSRGAASCIFIDHDPDVLKITAANIKNCAYEKISETIKKTCATIGKKPDHLQPRNLILLDPPYRKDLVIPAATALFQGGWLASHALLIAETEKNWHGTLPDAFENVLIKPDGDSQLNIWYLNTP